VLGKQGQPRKRGKSGKNNKIAGKERRKQIQEIKRGGGICRDKKPQEKKGGIRDIRGGEKGEKRRTAP